MNNIIMKINDLNVLVKHYAGSLSYGTNLPTSDVDVRGIFCADPINIRTPFFPVGEVTIPEEEDSKLYELSKFIRLYVDGNPNILETLWVDESDIIESSIEYDFLRSHAARLLSSKIAFTFSGYAFAQLKRIKGHNKWINSPQPVEPPKHMDYLKMIQNYTADKIMPRDFCILNYANMGLVHYAGDTFGIVKENTGSTVMTSDGDFNISVKQNKIVETQETRPLFIFKYNKDEFLRARDNHTNYWTWKNNRNEKRSELEENFGYDTKHAMHLVRLLRMGEEILSGKGVIVKRPDAKELLEIRNGSWSYEELLDYAHTKDDLIRNELYKNTGLPKKPNIKLAADVLISVQDMCWSK